jgi:salicylate hydroxylase
MSGREDRVLIAGGGIGGLATAIALGRRGIETEVLERSSFADETGAGIQLGPNAASALAGLSVLETIEPQAFRPEAIWIFDGLSGRRLTSVALGRSAEQRYNAPYLTLHRVDLHAGLRAAAQSLAAVTLTPGFELAEIDPDAAAVVARTADGRDAKGKCLIGADGLWSAVRALMAPRSGLHFTGATAWRAVMPRSDLAFPFDAPIVGLWLGPGTHLVHYPLRGGRTSMLSPSSPAAPSAKAGTNRRARRLCSPVSRAGTRIRNHCWNSRKAGAAGRSIALLT